MNNIEIVNMFTKLVSIAVEAKEYNGTDVFISYSPHVQSADVQVHLGGWKDDYNDNFFNFNFFYFNKASQADADAYLEKIKSCIHSGPTKEQEKAKLAAELAEVESKRRAVKRKIKKLEG